MNKIDKKRADFSSGVALTPWRFSQTTADGETFGEQCVITSAVECYAGSRELVKIGYALTVADAARIVLAVNNFDALTKLLREYVSEYPAFRSANLGAPGSSARGEQDTRKAMEDDASALLAKCEPEKTKDNLAKAEGRS